MSEQDEQADAQAEERARRTAEQLGRAEQDAAWSARNFFREEDDGSAWRQIVRDREDFAKKRKES